MTTNKNTIDREIKKILFFIFTFLLILMVMSISLWGAFSRDSSGVIADSKTGLAWQDDYSDNGGEIKRATWQDALIYCHELQLGGKSDWRLPNIIELYSIWDRSKYNPAMSSIFQKTTLYTTYWSSTTRASDSSYMLVIHSNSGDDDLGTKTVEYHVRCVRGGQ